MAKLLILIAEMGVFGATFSALAFVSWTKMTLGAALTFIGAYFPTSGHRNDAANHTRIRILGSEVSFSGAIKVGVIVGGVILIIGSVVDGAATYFDKANASDEIDLQSICAQDLYKALCANLRSQ